MSTDLTAARAVNPPGPCLCGGRITTVCSE